MAINFITTPGGVTQAGQNLGTGAVDALHRTEYGGEVEHTLSVKSFMRRFVKVKPLEGSTLTNDLVGESSLQAVGRGSFRADPTSMQFGTIAVKVDTIILARATMPKLDEFQNRIDARKELGVSHGKLIAEDFDESFIVQGIKCAQQDATGKPQGWVGGTTSTITNANMNDSAAFLVAIEDLVTAMEEKKVDMEECVLMLRPAQYMTLVRNTDLVDRDLSMENGNRAARYILRASGLPIIKTTLMPKAAVVDHKLSNAANGNAYDVTATDALCAALIIHPKTLLAGESIPLTSDVYYDKKELQWYVDSFLAYAVTPNRPDHTGAIFIDTW